MTGNDNVIKYPKGKLIKRLTLISLILLLAMIFLPQNTVYAADTDGDGIDNILEDQLLTRFAPRLFFTSGENFYPIDANFSISTSELYRWSGGAHVLVDANPSEASLTGYTDQHFLKSKFASYETLRTNYQANEALLGYKIYGHVLDESGFRYIQFWFFYAYNDGPINQHEGDWEMIQIQCYTNNTPIAAQYSQHHSGESAAWVEVEKTGDQPHVYVARGSHANYFRPYQGKVGTENDIVDNNGKVLTNATYTIENLGELGTPLNGNNWIDFQGRWGNWASYADANAGFAGPRGPGWGENLEKFTTPTSWAAGLFTVDTLWFILCWIMYYLLYIVLAFIVLWSIRKIYKIYKVQKEGGLLVGNILKTRAGLGVFLGFAALGLTIYALFVPWYSVLADIDSPTITAAGTVFQIDGLNGAQVNFLVTGTGMTPLFSLGIPFSILIAAGIIFNVLDIIGVRDPKKLGNGYIRSGLTFIILLVILVLIMTQFTAIMNAFSGGVALPSEATNVANAISQSPFQGSYSQSFYSGTVNIAFFWGFAIGGIILLISAIVKIIAGFIIRTAPKDFA
ncbi:MAG: Vps62-related protein [Candidatus Helarchaeota archaeon]